MLIHSYPNHKYFPEEMKKKDQWINWIPIFDKNPKSPRFSKFTKCPYDVKTGRKINGLDPKQFLSINEASSRVEVKTGTFGIGFVLTDQPFCFDSHGSPFYLIGLDIDRKCGYSTGACLKAMKTFFNGAYWEKSPSGLGWRVFCLSKTPIKNRNKDGFEIYISGRFLTMTGAQASGDLIDCTNQVRQLYEGYFSEPPSKKQKPIQQIKLIETEKNIATLKAALSFINPDCDYEKYIKIVWAIKSTGWVCADSVAEIWSKGAMHRFEDNTLQTLLNSYDPLKGISLGSLFHFAKLGGYKK